MEGWKALTERRRYAGAMRFMMQYDSGYGDYSKERHELFATPTMDELAESMTRSWGRDAHADSFAASGLRVRAAPHGGARG